MDVCHECYLRTDAKELFEMTFPTMRVEMDNHYTVVLMKSEDDWRHHRFIVPPGQAAETTVELLCRAQNALSERGDSPYPAQILEMYWERPGIRLCKPQKDWRHTVLPAYAQHRVCA